MAEKQHTFRRRNGNTTPSTIFYQSNGNSNAQLGYLQTSSVSKLNMLMVLHSLPMQRKSLSRVGKMMHGKTFACPTYIIFLTGFAGNVHLTITLRRELVGRHLIGG
jgi:hypothetical protein